MFLTIPVSKLLDSQLDIGIDPHSGNFTYNIKDTPSRLQHGYATRNLMLTLQSSAGGGGSSICLRVCANSHQSMDASQALEFALVPTGVTGQSDQHHACSAELSAPSIPVIHAQDFFNSPSGYENPEGASGSYCLQSKNHGPPDPGIYQASPWEVPQEKNPQLSQEPILTSPISKTLSLIASGSIFEDLTNFDSLDFSGYSNLHYNPNGFHADMTGYPSRSYSSESASDMIDGRAFGECSEASASYASLQTSVFSGFGPSVQSSPLSQYSASTLVSPWVATGVLEVDKSVESHAESSGNNHEVPVLDILPTTSTSFSESSTLESPLPSREGKSEGYPCPFATCERVLKSLYTQQLHMKTHTAKPRKNFACTMGCSESFTRHHDRLRHEVSQHGKQCEFSCKRCDRFFSSQRMLDRHTCWSSRIGPLRWQIKDYSDSRSET